MVYLISKDNFLTDGILTQLANSQKIKSKSINTYFWQYRHLSLVQEVQSNEEPNSYHQEIMIKSTMSDLVSFKPN